MSILFAEGFKLIPDERYESDDRVEDGLNNIGCLSEIASGCSQVAAMLSEGLIPSDDCLVQLTNASAVLSDMSQEISGQLTTLNTNQNKLNN